jgi:hypothetical protein
MCCCDVIQPLSPYIACNPSVAGGAALPGMKAMLLAVLAIALILGRCQALDNGVGMAMVC